MRPPSPLCTVGAFGTRVVAAPDALWGVVSTLYRTMRPTVLLVVPQTENKNSFFVGKIILTGQLA